VIKVIVLLVGLAIGFGAGVWWGVKNPEQAQKLAAEEERRVLEKQKELLAKMKAKLDQLASSRTGTSSGTSGATGRGFVSGAQSAAPKDPEVDRLKAESDEQMKELDKLLVKTGGK
jgi:uncharacterized protein HemX